MSVRVCARSVWSGKGSEVEVERGARMRGIEESSAASAASASKGLILTAVQTDRHQLWEDCEARKTHPRCSA